jgi:quercetin dioxygenase-like cupin family protein
MSFVDERGEIRDLVVGPLDSVTEIVTRKGAVRGNHFHNRTTQWTYVVSGWLRVVTPYADTDIHSGGMWVDEPGVAHAWEALQDTLCLVFTRGPRSGGNYECDTVRLEVPLI